MYNLFIKDFYLVKKHLWVAIFYSFMMFFLFNAQGAEFEGMVQGMIYSVGSTMIGYTMIMYTTAYDDKNNSDVLLNSLPISRSKIVLCRYISIFIFAILGVSSMIIAGFILDGLNIIDVKGIIGFDDLAASIIGLSFITFLYLPIYFKYGYVKAKIFNLILFVISFAGPVFLKKMFDDIEKPIWIDKFILYLNSSSDITIAVIFSLFILVLGLISFSLATAFYKRREF